MTNDPLLALPRFRLDLGYLLPLARGVLMNKLTGLTLEQAKATMAFEEVFGREDSLLWAACNTVISLYAANELLTAALEEDKVTQP